MGRLGAHRFRQLQQARRRVVGNRLRAWLEPAEIFCEIFPNETFADCMAARLPASGGGNRPIVSMGHRDIVFRDGTATQRPFRIDRNQALGPGVADMKPGLVMNTFLLEAFRRFPAPCPPTGLYTSDEGPGAGITILEVAQKYGLRPRLYRAP